MDDLGWERSMSFQWSSINQQQQLENMFINPVQQLHKTDSSIQEINSNSERVSHQMVHQLAPALDSINNVANSNYNFSRRQEAIRLAADTVLAKSGAGDPIAEFVNSGAAQASMESLDCLLSATNSNADTSVEDDGISVIFNDCKKLWNNNFGTISGGSSGDSVSKEVEEIISQCSSEKRPNSNSPKRSSSSTIHVDPQYGFSENNPAKPKKPRSEKGPSSSNINFQQPNNSMEDEPDSEAIAQMKEMIYRAAAFMPVNFGVEEGVEKPKRKNVRISSDPQTVAARQRRERISERIRVLQRLVPGGRKMDTASMLDEAANYLKFLRSQVKALETLGQKIDLVSCPNTTSTLPSHQMHMNMNPLSLYSSSSSSLIPFNHHYNSFPMQKTHFPLQNLHPNPPPA